MTGKFDMYYSFNTIDRLKWLESIQTLRNVNSEVNSIAIAFPGISKDNLLPEHIVTLACLAEDFTHKHKKIRLLGDENFIAYLTTYIQFTEYWNGKKNYVDALESNVLNLWRFNAGEILYGIMTERWTADDSDKVLLDLSGITLVPSMLLNVSIGRVLREKGVDYIKSHVSFSNITLSQAQRIRDYVAKFS